MENKKFYITTSIAYMNAAPHIGFAYELVLADVIARYHRGLKEETFFLTGADEHGDKIARASKKEGLAPQDFVDRNAILFQALIKKLRISNDLFIRTSDKKHHWLGAMNLWSEIEKAGDIYRGKYEGFYCVGCEAFITEKELVDGKCPTHNTAPESIKEENYFFKLSKYAPELKSILQSGKLKIIPESKINEMIALIDAGLDDVSISRPEGAIPWGIPVPNDSSQLMYVWCDALSNYISALGYGRVDDENFKKFWPADVQVIGKDIVRFHSILWPAFLLSAKIPLPKELLVHGFVISGGKKMSKSLGNVLDPNEFIDAYGGDALRYYFSREVSTTEDWDLTREKFKETYNANLANGLGNLVSRTLKMAEQYWGGKVSGDASSVPPIRTRITETETLRDLGGFNIPYLVTNNIFPRYHEHMRANEINRGGDVVWELISYLDQFIADYEPFKLVKTDKTLAEKTVWGILYGLQAVSEMITPMMPSTAEKMDILLGPKVKVDSKGDFTFSVTVPKEPLFMRKQ
ncbi:MAG: methionine--tRNA ligase [Candidatus Pacebacteria bacterium]|nr:methionine--tRNA ligase [Candidatus Paceibacterota bacterium]